jgi:hypothetical protein
VRGFDSQPVVRLGFRKGVRKAGTTSIRKSRGGLTSCARCAMRGLVCEEGELKLSSQACTRRVVHCQQRHCLHHDRRSTAAKVETEAAEVVEREESASGYTLSGPQADTPLHSSFNLDGAKACTGAGSSRTDAESIV